MTEVERPATVRLVLAWAAVYLIWGSTYLGIRFAIETIPPFLMAGSRHLLAGLLLFTWSRLRQRTPSPTRQDWVRAAGLGVLMLVCANGATTWAEQLVPSGLTALIVCTSALWLVLLNWLWLGAARPSARTVVGIGAGFAGVALLVVPGNFAGSEHVDLLGALVLLGASLSWSVGSIYALKLPRPRHQTLFVSQQMIVAGAILLLIAAGTGEFHGFSIAAVSRTSATAYLYLALFGSLISFSAYFWLIRHTTPDRLATISYVNPLVAVILGWALASEALSLRILVAAAVILFAVGLITTTRMQARA